MLPWTLIRTLSLDPTRGHKVTLDAICGFWHFVLDDSPAKQFLKVDSSVHLSFALSSYLHDSVSNFLPDTLTLTVGLELHLI